jgi:single-strand DNA-binding protein
VCNALLNKVILIGRLTRDPELRYTANGVAVATFTLAVDRPFVNQQGQREADFIRIVVWQKLAEICANNLGKGRLVAVEGRLQVRSYDTPEGQKRQVSEVVAENVRFLDWPKEGGKGSAAPFGGEEDPFGSGFDLPADDLPF